MGGEWFPKRAEANPSSWSRDRPTEGGERKPREPSMTSTSQESVPAKMRRRCGKSARRVLSGGRPEGVVPTGTESPGVQFLRATRLVLCFEHADDAAYVWSVLEERFKLFGLTLHPKKTRSFALPARPLSMRGGRRATSRR
jgi:hypothetical protein